MLDTTSVRQTISMPLIGEDFAQTTSSTHTDTFHAQPTLFLLLSSQNMQHYSIDVFELFLYSCSPPLLQVH